MTMRILVLLLMYLVTPTSQDAMTGEAQFDVVVIGAGPAGVIAASRLASNPEISVALLEQGGPLGAKIGGNLYSSVSVSDNDGLTMFDIPGDGEMVAWQDVASEFRSTVPEDHWANLIRGVGGSAQVGPNQYQRAPDAYLDAYFPEGWQAKDLEEYYDRHKDQVKQTTLNGITTNGEESYLNTVFEIAQSAAESIGFPPFLNDTERTNKVGYGYPTVMLTENLERGGPVSLYFEDIVDKTGASTLQNLEIFYFTDVRLIEFDDASPPQATAVRYFQYKSLADLDRKDNPESQTKILLTPNTGVVILAAGALSTPAILIRSGIGNKDIPESSFFDTVNDNPNLGTVIDHVGVRVAFKVMNDAEFSAYFYDNETANEGDLKNYINNRTGPYTQFSQVFHMVNISRSQVSDAKYPDIQYVAHPYGAFDLNNRLPTSPLAQNNYFELFVFHRNPKSRGKLVINKDGSLVRRNSAEYLVHDDDKNDLVSAVFDIMNFFFKADPKYGLDVALGPCFDCPQDSTTLEQNILFYVEQPVASADHSVATSFLVGNAFTGTCPMHRNLSLSCVDPKDLRVFGTANVHIMDASVLPNVPVSPLATVMAVAEKCSDILLQIIHGTFTDPPDEFHGTDGSVQTVLIVTVVSISVICLCLCAVFCRPVCKRDRGKNDVVRFKKFKNPYRPLLLAIEERLLEAEGTPSIPIATLDSSDSKRSSNDEGRIRIVVSTPDGDEAEKVRSYSPPNPVGKVEHRKSTKGSDMPTELEEIINYIPVKIEDFEEQQKPEEEKTNQAGESTTTQFHDMKSSYFYPTKHPRGYALVIGNGNGGVVQRSCHRDAEAMKSSLEHIGYKVIHKMDQKSIDIIRQLRDLRMMDHSGFDSFVFYFSGHGGENVIYGHNDEEKNYTDDPMEVAEIVEFFEPRKCKTLSEKPKIFLWDCCRGDEREKSKSKGVLRDEFIPPGQQDCLYGYAAGPSKISYVGDRTRTDGLSVYTYFLSNRLKNDKEHDLARILTFVQNDVKEYVEKHQPKKKQVANHHTYLTKLVKVHPG